MVNDRIKALDLEGLISQSVSEVFDTMLSMQVEAADRDSERKLEGNRIVGSVSFAGEVMGNLCIHVGKDFARLMAAAMLEMAVEDVEEEEEVIDVVGEMSNMIGGGLKSRFCDSGMPCELSIPSITDGNDFKVSAMNWEQHESILFRYQEHKALVEIFVRAGN
ncbi:MAG: chemotaxis protein CheX [Deltaproteobacteria bacterium]|nr:chemotaxis protein CheX [Deltaproteobacteria bacterium]